MFSKIKQAVLMAAQVQHLALLLAWGAATQPLVQKPGARGFSLGRQDRWDQASLPLALSHPLVRLALRLRELRLHRLQRRMASRTST